MFRGLKRILIIFACVFCVANTGVYADIAMPNPTLSSINTQLTNFLNNTTTHTLTKTASTDQDIQIIIDETTYYTTPTDSTE